MANKKVSFSDAYRQWAKRQDEIDTNRLSEAQAAIRAIEENGDVLTDAQKNAMTQQFVNTGAFDFSVGQEQPPASKADFSGVTSSVDSTATDSEQGLLGRISTYGSAAIDALQSGLAKSGQAAQERGATSDNPYMRQLAQSSELLGRMATGDFYSDPIGQASARPGSLLESVVKRNEPSVQAAQQLAEGQGTPEKWAAQAVLDAASSPTGALSIVGGPFGAAGVYDAYNQAYKEAYDAGLRGEDAETWAISQAAPETLGVIPAGKLLGKTGLGKKASAKIAGTIAEKLTSPGLAAAIRISKTMGGEALEEMATGATQDLTAAAIAGYSANDKLKEFAGTQAPKDTDEFLERRRREAGAAVVFGAAGIPGGIKEARQQFNEQVNTRAEDTTTAALANAQATAERNASPAAIPVRQQRASVAKPAAQGELFPDIPGGQLDTVDVQDNAPPTDAPSDDVRYANQRRAVLKGLAEQEQQRIADLEQRQKDAPLLQESGYDSFTEQDAAELDRSRERLDALNREQARWSGAAVSQDNLQLNEPKQPKPAKPKNVQTRGGDTYYTPEGETRSKADDAALQEANKLLSKQSKDDQGAINKEYNYQRDKRNEDRKKALDSLADQARAMPIDERPGFIAKGIRSWDNSNPAIDKSSITLEQATAAIDARSKKKPATEQKKPAWTPPAPVVTEAPAAPTKPAAKPGTVDAQLDDISNKLALGMQEEHTANATEGSAPFNADEYKSKVKDVIHDLAKTNTQGSVDAINLINQGKMVIAPSPESIGRESTNDVAQYEPSEGKMYLYTDRLNKGDTLGAVIRTYHEATHAGQFNDRQGRPDMLRQIMGKDAANKAQGIIRRAAQNGNALAKDVVQKARRAAGDDANIEQLELLPYFVGEVVRKRGSTLGQLRGVANDMLAKAKQFVGKATGAQFDVTMKDLESAVSGVGREIVNTDLTPSQGDTRAMIYGENAADFAAQDAAERTYTSQDGKRKFVLSDADAKFTPNAEADLLATLNEDEGYKLSDLFDHPTLYRNYPEARDIVVALMENAGPREQGRYLVGNNMIELSPKLLLGNSDITAREILLHEIQHWVQEKSGGKEVFLVGEPAPKWENDAIAAFGVAKRANDAAAEELLNQAPRIALDVDDVDTKSAIRSVARATGLPVFRRAHSIANELQKQGIKLSGDNKLVLNNFIDSLNAYREAADSYNNAQANRHRRYVGKPTEAEAFFTQRNVDTQQAELPLNPETEDADFGTVEGADMSQMSLRRQLRALGMSEDTATGPANRWVPAWITGLARADKGLSRVDNEIIENAIASPAGARMRAEAEMGKFDNAVAKLAASQGSTKEAMNAKIQEAINSLPKDLNTHAENVAAFNEAMRPFGSAGKALMKMRDQVDDLTMQILKQRADSGIPLTEADKKLYKTMIENMGKYTHRQYAAHAGKLGNQYATKVWKDYEKYGKGKRSPAIEENYRKVASATSWLVDNNLSIPDNEELTKLGADQTRRLYETWKGPSDGVSLEQMKDHLFNVRDLVNGNKKLLNQKAEEIAKELLGLAEAQTPTASYYRGGKQDNSILKQRQKIAPELRELMGEITDPSMRLLVTVAKQAEFVGRNRMMLELAKSDSRDLLPPASVKPDGWTELKGEGYGPLQGFIASPNMVSAIGDVQQTLATFQQAVAMASRNPTELAKQGLTKAGSVWGKMASTTKGLQIIWNPINFAYNFVGGPLTMAMNGNVNPANFAKGMRSAIELVSYAINPKSAKEDAIRLVENDVVDSAFVGEIKNEQYRELRKVVEQMAGKKNLTPEGLADMLHKAKAGAKETYAMADVMYKIANFYHQVDVLTDFYKKNGEERTPEQIDREAADVVKRTNFTYRRVAPLLKAIEAAGFSSFGPYMHEVVRTQFANVAQGLSEYQRAKNANTPEARNAMLLQATKRISGQMAVWAGTGLMSAFLSGVTFGDDDDENEAKRALLPEYAQDQDFFEIGKDAKGNPVLFNVSRFDPFGPMTDIMRSMLQGGVEVEQLSKKLVDMYVAPRIGGQTIKALTTTFGSDRPTRVPLAQQLAPEAFSWAIDTAREVGVPASVLKSWVNVGETFYPGIMNSWRSTNARPVSPDDATTATYNAMSYMGMQLNAVDPASNIRFQSMDYADRVKEGRKDLMEFFKDNPNRSVEDTMSMLLDLRQKEKESFDDLKKVYDGATSIGVSKRVVNGWLKQQKLNAAQIKGLSTDNFASSIVSTSSMKQLEKQELSAARSASERKEIKAKWRDIGDVLKSATREINEEEND